IAAFICNELVFTLCGYLIFNENLTLLSTIWACSLGAAFGAMLPYWLSYYGGRPLIDRYGKYFGCTPPKMKKAEYWFQRYGSLAIFITRFIPGLRSVISFPAGAAKMSQFRYAFFTLLGTLIWAIILVQLGYAFGENWYLLFQWLDCFDSVIIIVCGVIILGLLGQKYLLPYWQKKRN
ncbi:MAG: DedA family protein, partial [Clostridia bacterium]|nr:DedA family protein [Clostridia bacterium]